MPIKIGNKKFDAHKQAVKYIKRTKSYITKPNAYVDSIERKQRKFSSRVF